MSVTIVYKVDDTSPLQFTIEDWDVESQGTTAHDLTNETVTFSMIKVDALNWSIENQPCSIVTPTSGLVKYIWATGETATRGMYKCVWRVTGADGKVSTYPEDDIQWLWIVDDSAV